MRYVRGESLYAVEKATGVNRQLEATRACLAQVSEAKGDQNILE
jgi:hypothetical protein